MRSFNLFKSYNFLNQKALHQSYLHIPHSYHIIKLYQNQARCLVKAFLNLVDYLVNLCYL